MISVKSFMNGSPKRRNDLPKVIFYLVVYRVHSTLSLGGLSFIFNMAHGCTIHLEFIVWS